MTPFESFTDMEKALNSYKPSDYFRSLPLQTLEEDFPELYALIGKIQPTAYHPEGDAFDHTMEVVDYVSHHVRRNLYIEGIESVYGKMDLAKACFCALMHDIGKGTTSQEMLPHYYGHEKRGMDVIDSLDKRIGLPQEWKEAAKFVSKYHMMVRTTKKAGSIVKCLMALDKAPITPHEFAIICEADSPDREVPKWLWYDYPYDLIKRLKYRIDEDDAPKGLSKEEVEEWLHCHRSHLFHRMYKDILKYGRMALCAYAPFKD